MTKPLQILLPILLLTGNVSFADDWNRRVQPLVKAYCLDCHSGNEPSAGLNLLSLKRDLHNAEQIRIWTLIHDRVQSGEMPPDDATPIPQPQRNEWLNSLAKLLADKDRKHSDVVLRRLNRIEYENTVRDLFGVDVRVKELLPQDNPTEGFDNVGEGLAMSAEAAQAYLQAADATLDAVFGPAKKPRYITHQTNLLDQKTFDGKPALDRHIGSMFRRTKNGLVIFQSNYCPTNLVNFARLRPPAGTYRGTLKVRAIQSEKPVTLRIYGGDTIVGRREKHLVGYYDVPPDKWTTITFEDRLVEGGGTYQPKCYGTRDTRKNADTYPEPGIEIGDITIEGPLEEWPPRSRRMLLGNVDLSSGTLDDLEAILRRILPTAFRRPITPEDAAPFLALGKSALDEGRSFEAALRLALKGMLCSPEFLYLHEPGEKRITQHALAARLSYFLWSSLPDAELHSLADRGVLSKPEVLKQQTERMLYDPKASEFTENFVGQWLELREIDFTSPDQNLYPDFDELLRVSMVEETHRFFNEILQHDLSLLNFIDADFTFLNQRLAEHYGILGVTGQQFRKVILPASSVRGGVMTQAAILKVTANGTTTSPVLRGAWVMEKLLGERVPPPPSNVPAVEPDIRGAVTLREQLKQHRNEESCAVCHEKIDPAGFALENFDVIGGWRDNYRTLGEGKRPEFSQDPHTFAWVRYRIGSLVDATGKTHEGHTFRDITEFKQIVLQQPTTITQALTEQLTIYALGRRIGFSDRPQLQTIVNSVEQRERGFRSLIHEIVQSDLFQKP